MLKFYHIILLLSILVYSHSQSYVSDCEKTTNPSSKSECVDKLSTYEKEESYHCCFVSGKKDGVTQKKCEFISNEEYKNIGDVKGDYEDSGYKEVSVECKSYFLHLSLLSLLLILL